MIIALGSSSTLPIEDYLTWIKDLDDSILEVPPKLTVESLKFALELNITTSSISDQCIPDSYNGDNSTHTPVYSQRCNNVTCAYPKRKPLEEYEVPLNLTSISKKFFDHYLRLPENPCQIVLLHSVITFFEPKADSNGTFHCDFEKDRPFLILPITSNEDSFTLGVKPSKDADKK